MSDKEKIIEAFCRAVEEEKNSSKIIKMDKLMIVTSAGTFVGKKATYEDMTENPWNITQNRLTYEENLGMTNNNSYIILKDARLTQNGGEPIVFPFVQIFVSDIVAISSTY